MSSRPLEKRLCLSGGVDSCRELAALVAKLPPQIDLIEVRLDLLEPSEIRSEAWLAFPKDGTREWLATWRSPREGGRHERPPGIYARALDHGYHWIDVEAQDLHDRDPDAEAVPGGRRWVSAHQLEPCPSLDSVYALWRKTAAHTAALHKCVVTADRFSVNDWVLEVGRAAREKGPASVFAQGWPGHASRIVGHLEGNAVTFLAAKPWEGTAPGQPTWRDALERYRITEATPRSRLFGVMGDAVRRSRSPDLHNHAFRVLEEPAIYLPLETRDAEPVVEWLRSGRLTGISVTTPFKERMARLVDRTEEAAAGLGAVNTVWRDGEELVGANTDAEAAAALIPALIGESRSGVAILGAGGAAAAVAVAARGLGLQVTLFNRSPARGRQLALRLQCRWGGGLEDLNPQRVGLVVNATPLGSGEPLPAFLADLEWDANPFLDLGYGKGRSEWEALAERTGSSYRGGLDFLVHQAAGQCRRWTGQPMETHVLEQALW